MDKIMYYLAEVTEHVPNNIIFTLLGLIFLDYITGILSVFYTKEVNSKLHYKGVIKKLSILLSAVTGLLIDLLFGTDGLFTVSIILLLSANEALSIIENLGKMGVFIPKFIKDSLIQLRDKEDNRETVERIELYKYQEDKDLKRKETYINENNIKGDNTNEQE